MQIKIKLLNGRLIDIEVEETTKVSELKGKLEEIEGISTEQQRLVFGGRQIADEKTLGDLHIKAGTTINLLLALRGGF